MAIILNFETQQVEYDMSSSQQTPPTSSLGVNERNKGGDQQPVAAATIQNMEDAPPAFQDPNQRPRRNPHARHTKHQINEMENFFKGCPHPDEKQRRELANSLGMNSMQVKFWFQNKRTQMKAMFERHKNNLLTAEVDKLRAEILKYKEALSNAKCSGCGGQPFVGEMSFKEQELRLENARLKEKIEKITTKIAEITAGASFSNPPPPTPHTPMPSRLLADVNYVPQPSMAVQGHGGSSDSQRSIINAPFTEPEKTYIVGLAVGAMEEFKKMAHDGPPLWIPGFHNEILNQREYVRIYKDVGLGPKPMGFRSEASRETITVTMNPSNLIDILMDVDKWSTMFPDIVSRARTTEILSTGVTGNYDGALQAMSAEFQVLSHVVPNRESYFIRYCKLHSDGAWVVVDISLDYMRLGAATKCRRRPSGCMIQELPNGFSKVTWIEHVEIEDKEAHVLFKHLVDSGFAFGARRWTGTLDRQCERLACTMASNVPPEDLSGISSEGRKNVLKLAEKIMHNYCNYVGASPSAHVWTVYTTPPTGTDDVRVMTRNHTDASGAIVGIVISVTTSFSLPIPSKMLFDFLQNENSRNHWDILTNGFLVEKMAHIASGRNPDNFVSLLRPSSTNAGQKSKIIVQETCTDSTGSYVVFAPIELCTVNSILSGLNPDYGMLHASGFSIFPRGPGLSGGPTTDVGSGGCLGTFAYQVLVEETPAPLAPDLVSSLCNFMKCTIEKIQAAMMSVST